MKPLEKLSAYAVSLTVATMFAGLKLTKLPADGNNPQGLIVSLVTLVLGSIGVYIAFSKIAYWILSRWEWLLKWTLGPYYVKGRWGGLVLTRSRKPRYIVENIEQTLASINIQGASYLPNGRIDANWTTESVQIDPVRGLMFAFYVTNVPKKNNAVEALGRLQFFRVSERNGPFKMTGYAIDSDSTIKLRYVELRKLDFGDGETNSAALDEAALKETIRLFEPLMQNHLKEVPSDPAKGSDDPPAPKATGNTQVGS